MENGLVILQNTNKVGALIDAIEASDNWSYKIGTQGNVVDVEGYDAIFRYGATHSLNGRGEDVPIVNTARSIHRCYDKVGARKLLDEVGIEVPEIITSTDQLSEGDKLVARPVNHSQGRDVVLINSVNELANFMLNHNTNDWYISRVVEKTNEYRIWMAQGTIFYACEKHPEDRNQFTWGGDNARWESIGYNSIPKEFYEIAEETYEALGIEIAAIDVIYDGDKYYFLEANTSYEATSPYVAKKTLQVATDLANDVLYNKGMFIERNF